MPVSAKFRAAQKLVKQAQRGRRYTKAVIPRSMPASVSRQVATALARQTEAKYVDWNAGTFTIESVLSDNGTIYAINPMQAGVGFFNRVGRKTKTLSLRIKGTIATSFVMNLAPTPPAITGQQIRIALVYDREPTAVVPPFNTIFSQVDNVGTSTVNLNSALAMSRADRFRIISDELMDIPIIASPISTDADINGNTDETNSIFQYNHIDKFFDVSKRDLTQLYLSTTNPAELANLSNGAIYLVLKARQNNSNTQSAWVDGGVRIKVSDV